LSMRITRMGHHIDAGLDTAVPERSSFGDTRTACRRFVFAR
jgi:hypothetical protein